MIHVVVLSENIRVFLLCQSHVLWSLEIGKKATLTNKEIWKSWIIFYVWTPSHFKRKRSFTTFLHFLSIKYHTNFYLFLHNLFPQLWLVLPNYDCVSSFGLQDLSRSAEEKLSLSNNCSLALLHKSSRPSKSTNEIISTVFFHIC